MPYKKTSSCIEVPRAGTRGAALLESVVVISVLTLGLTALVYVRDLYVKDLGAARLARAAVLAHSMAGCKSNEPSSWLGRDTAGYRVQNSAQDPESAHGKDDDQSTPSSSKASGLLQRSGSTSSDGKGLLNPITDATVTGQAQATGRAGGRETRTRTVFSGEVRATSYVSCGDEVKDGDFDRVMGVMKDEISTLLGK